MFLAIAVSIAVAGCSGRGKGAPEETGAAAAREAAHDPDEIILDAGQAARAGVRTEKVVRGPFRETLACSGIITTSPSDIEVISAPVAGVVSPVDGRVVANSPVKSGQPLFRVSSGTLASGDAVAKARIAYEQAEADFKRIDALLADKLVTQSDWLDAQGEYLRAKAEYDPVRESDGRGTVVHTPAAGYVLGVSVAPGDYVEMGSPLATIARKGRMQLRALVSQRYFDAVGTFDDAAFSVPGRETVHRVSRLGGSLLAAGRAVDPGTAMIPVIFEMDAAGLFADGSYADVVLLGRERPDVVSVPLPALTERQGLYFVYLRTGEDVYVRREVRPGGDDGERVEILEGLSGGEDVVVSGAVHVRMAGESGGIPQGHTH